MTEQECKKYLETECLHPMRIVNKYTHEAMYVRCGKCPACMAHKSNVQCGYISNMASHFRYAYFFTLTYSDKFIPRVKIVVQERRPDMSTDAYTNREEYLADCYSAVDSDPRNLDPSVTDEYSIGFEYILRSGRVRVSPLGKARTLDENYRPYLFSWSYKPKELHDLIIKAHGEYDRVLKKVVYPKSIKDCTDTIPVLNHTDQQLFMKRLRFYLSEITDEKISYYLVSEYGPRTLRPHWHGILFFNSSKISEVICELVSKAWLYGSADTSLSRGSAAGYVASYINSTVSIPDFYKLCLPVKPRSYHSKGFGSYSKFYKSASVQKIREVAAMCFDGFSEPIGNGEYVTVKPPRSYERAVFPRFSDPDFASPYMRVDLYKYAHEVPARLFSYGYISIDELDKISLYEVAKRYAQWYMSRPAGFEPNYKDDLIFMAARLEGPRNLDYDMVAGKVYRVLSMVRRTLSFWRIDDYVTPPARDLYTIFKYADDYWSKRDARTLEQYFEYMEKVPESVDFLRTRTVGGKDFDPTESSRTFLSSLKSRLKQIVSDKIKHKEYNDLSGLLLNLN